VITCSELLPVLSNLRPSSSIHGQQTMAKSSSFSRVDIDLRDSLLTCKGKQTLITSKVFKPQLDAANQVRARNIENIKMKY
jgi:hypothetical protein